MSKRKPQAAVEVPPEPPDPTKRSARFEIITPQRALEMLEQEIGDNRVTKPTQVAKIQRDIEENRWIVTGSGVQYNIMGELFDGHHRLEACIAANEAIEVLVVRGLPMEAMEVVDQNTPRTMGDFLRWKAETDVNILGSIIRLAYLLDGGHLETYNWKWRVPSIAASYRWYEPRQDAIRAALSASNRLRRKPLFVTASIAGTFCWHANEHFPKETASFIEGVVTGENLVKGDPRMAYRDWIDEQQRLPGQLDQRIKLATILLAFIGHVKGSTMRRLNTWRPTNIDDEEFPKLPSIARKEDDDDDVKQLEPATAGRR